LKAPGIFDRLSNRINLSPDRNLDIVINGDDVFDRQEDINLANIVGSHNPVKTKLSFLMNGAKNIIIIN
jgi:hypothetical protein